ncbi:conjugal transfer protein [Nocardiopsis sp. HNM0947]|uniref:Conjugal transfer protein n=1 Tax=Nocardiopsis coralli TaxID=2772213 RepID=A0ABR9P8K2_9ACTN|nr:conjugal transfer protein [Nocardiopsis coralli]MBE3000172.1 conjugal transfer protein [Nocardiopsis coralli]
MAKGARRGTAVQDRAEETGFDDGFDEPSTKPPGRWAGGRWLVGAGRVVLWVFIAVVIVNGIMIPLRGGFALPAADDAPEQAETVDYPETAAAAFGLRFAEVYLNTEESGEERLEALAAYVPEGQAADLELPAESLAAENLTVFAVDVENENNAMVVVRADVNDEPMSLEVPVYSDGDSLVVSGRPALLGAPTRAELPPGASFETDDAAAQELQSVLPGFFEAYAQEPGHLDRYVEADASITPLPANSLEFAELSEITVPSQSTSGEEDVRRVAATVEWTLPAPDGSETGQLTQDYLVTVVDSGGEWHVRDIQGSPRSYGE